MARKGTAGTMNYLSVNSKGVLYKSYKTETEGAVKVKLNSIEGEADRFAWHEYFANGTEIGRISGIKVSESKYGDRLSITVTGENETDVIQVPMYSNGQLNDYVKNLACILPNLDLDRPVSIRPTTKKNDRGYVYRNFYINYHDEQGENGKEYVRLVHKFGADGDIPSAEKKKKLGKDVWDTEVQDNYLFEILEAQMERVNNASGTTTPSTAPTVKETNPTTQSNPQDQMTDGDEDDLPF